VDREALVRHYRQMREELLAASDDEPRAGYRGRKLGGNAGAGEGNLSPVQYKRGHRDAGQEVRHVKFGRCFGHRRRHSLSGSRSDKEGHPAGRLTLCPSQDDMGHCLRIKRPILVNQRPKCLNLDGIQPL
jgi:hypothetical protein